MKEEGVCAGEQSNTFVLLFTRQLLQYLSQPIAVMRLYSSVTHGSTAELISSIKNFCWAKFIAERECAGLMS